MRTAAALLAIAGISAAGLLPLGSNGDDEPCRPHLRDLTAPGCDVVAADTSAKENPTPLWGRVECESPQRVRQIERGGDRARTAGGERQGNTSYRWISVRDGDNYYGERCELGRNNHRPSAPTFALAREGDHFAVFFSIRLPPRFPHRGNAWQSVLQLKQTQPSANGSGSPQLGLGVNQAKFSLTSAGRDIWSIPARRERWVRFALNIRFSRDSDRGSVRLFADLNGDGDARDRRERSPRLERKTLKTETAGGDSDDGIKAGESIPAHLRVGVYHDDAYECPAPAGCAVHYDNVQVVDLADAD